MKFSLRTLRLCGGFGDSTIYEAGQYMQISILLTVLAFLQAVPAALPAYPPGAINGGNVVAVMHVAAGTVTGVDILRADEPFAGPVRVALGAWSFPPTESGDVLAVVNFRTPNLFAVGPAAKVPKAAGAPSGLAYPEEIVEPLYPANSVAEGSAVFQIAIGESGSVSKLKVIQGLGDLTDPCTAAVNRWKFAPARSARGAAAVSIAYAVCVVRRPVLSPVKKLPGSE